MKRINQLDINTPESYDKKFTNTLGITDMERIEKLAQYFEGGVYVDVGCFDSPMPLILAERYPDAEILAFDQAPGMIDFLATHLPQVSYSVADCYSLPLPDNFADCVVAGELIEHLERPQDAVAEWLRVLKPGGWLAISTPFEERNNEVGGPYHLWHWTVADVEQLLDTKETEVLQESTFRTILAWRQK